MAQAIGFKSVCNWHFRIMIFIPLLYQLIAYIRGGQLYQWLCYVEFHCADHTYCMRNSDSQFSIRLVAAALI